MHCYGLYKRVRQLDPIAKRKLVAIGFANDRYFPALQAADMLSFLCREQAMLQFHRIPYTKFEQWPIIEGLIRAMPRFSPIAHYHLLWGDLNDFG